MNFVHLSTHSKASMLYGSASISDLIDGAIKCGSDSIALTDYSNLFNAIEFYKSAKAKNIKPILGVDILFCEDVHQHKLQKSRQAHHLILLAENDIGWRNIARLVSTSYSDDYFYYVPRIDFNLLEKYKEGIICLSGNTFDGVISYHLYDKLNTSGNIDNPAALFRAEGLVRQFLKIFGNNNFFLEIQNNNFSHQALVNDRLRNIGARYSIKTVVTNNVHYAKQSDAEAHKTLLQMNENQYNKTTSADFSNEEYYIKNNNEMLQAGFNQSELNVSSQIADRCNITIDINKRRLPKYKFIPNGLSSIDYLTKLANEGLKNKIPNASKEYHDRLNRELQDIKEMGFADYFLIVHDVISWTKQHNILVGRGRGSAGGSLVSHCLDITDIDPIQYGLIWERFLNKGRGGLPDIDSDVPRSKRQKVLEYIRERFGANNVAQLVTFGGLQARSILKEVFRVYQMDFDEANKITSLLPMKNDEHEPISLDEAIEAVPELKVYEEKYKPWFTIARALESCYKSTGIHPSAVVISDEEFNDSSYPLARGKNGEQLFGWDMNTVDTLSLLKLDILGLNTLDDIQMTIDLINKRHKLSLSRDNIDLSNAAAYALISNGFTAGIFQLETQLGKQWSKKIQPQTIKEISNVISLIRPGPLESNLSERYRSQKINNDRTPLHEKLTDITYDTYGQPIYQEQLIYACQNLANMSLIEADLVRRAIGKKKPEELKKWKDRFVGGCIENNIKEIDATDIWEKFEKFAGYSFNLSHGVGYALLAYETAFLKSNYPLEFFCSKLINSDGDLEKISSLIYDAKLFGISITPPNIVVGNKDFDIIDDKTIAFGLGSLKGIGAVSINDLIKISRNVKTFDELLWKWITTKTKVTFAVMVSLIRSGAFKEILNYRVRGEAKLKLLEHLTSKEIDLIANKENWIIKLKEISDEKNVESLKIQKVSVPNVNRRESIRKLINEYESSELFDSKIQCIGWEKYYLGISVSGSESDMFKCRHRCIDIVRNGSSGMLFEIAIVIEDIHKHFTKKGDQMAFIKGYDNTYKLDNIVVFPNTFNKYSKILEPGNVTRIYGKMDERGSLIVNEIERLK